MMHRYWMTFLMMISSMLAQPAPDMDEISQQAPVYILPIREDIMPTLTYVVRRGVKEAIQAKAQCLILDMETHGGRVDVTEEIIEILGRFQGRTITYVNRKAFSAGAFISVATQEIYMAPSSVIGAAAPIVMSPGGGVDALPDTMEVKMTSGISALIRATAAQNGHDPEVIEAMIDKSKELIRDGVTLSEKGQILTLTDREAARPFGPENQPLLSLGTIDSLDDLLAHAGYASAPQVTIAPTGAEQVGHWFQTISPILLMIGIIGLYLEFKTPGFGLPGIVGITAFICYFLGAYIAALTGLEWALVFLLGLILLIMEIFVLPGTLVLGLSGLALIFWSLLMALVDMDPTLPVWTPPTLEQLTRPMEVFTIALAGSLALIYGLSRVLPKTALHQTLVSATASGEASTQAQWSREEAWTGRLGIALTDLHPGGKAQFEDTIIDVLTEGELIPKGAKVQILRFSSYEAVVAEVSAT